jgi:hypothetical protein
MDLGDLTERAGLSLGRNLSKEEWRQYFPDQPYRRTIRSLPWPQDLTEDERTQAEAWEKTHLEGKDAS